MLSAVEACGARRRTNSLWCRNAPAAFEKGLGTHHLWVRVTAGLRKIKGRWIVVHEHVSTPFYMDGSLRAAVDLTHNG